MAIRKDKVIKFSDKTDSRRSLDVHVEMYDSAADVVTDCRNRALRIKDYGVEGREIRKSWHGVDSYDEALGLLKNGYQPTVEKLKGQLNATNKDGNRFSFNNNIQGFTPIIPLALKGVPNCMVDMSMKKIKSKVLDIYYDITATCERDPDEFIRAGKELLGIIIELEKKGYRFNLYAIQSYIGNEVRTEKFVTDVLCVKIKSSNKPLDLKRISFPLTHPAFFRVIGFDWEGKSPITRNIGWGRGHSMDRDYDQKDLNYFITTLFGNNACYVSCSRFIASKYDTKALKEGLMDVSNAPKSHNKAV